MSPNNPLVSVIMPAYNAEKYIEESILSIINQTYQNWELIIINDGSTDQTAQIIQQFVQKDSRLRLSDNGTNKGLIVTRNIGLECAKGKYIANLDSDDIANSDRLEKQVAFLEKNLDYVLLGSACIHIDDKGKKIASVERNIPNEHLITLLLFSNYFINSSIMVRAVVAKEIGYANETPLAEDYNFFVSLSEKGKLGNLNSPLVKYRIHEGNISKERETELDSIRSEIQLKQIQKMGLLPSTREMRIHSSLVEGNSIQMGFDLIETESWLLKLVEKNQKERKYPDELFKYYAAFFYRRACQRGSLGSKAILTFRKSSLSKFIKHDVKGNSIFFIKSILKLS